MLLTKEQILDLFAGWHIDTEQPDDWLRLDKGIKDTGDKVCYAYFVKVYVQTTEKRTIEYAFDRFEIQ